MSSSLLPLRRRARRLEETLRDVRRTLLAIKHLPRPSIRDAQALAHDALAKIEGLLPDEPAGPPVGHRLVPTTTADGQWYIRYLDLSAGDVVRFGYPKHPDGRYVLVEDLRRCLTTAATLQGVLEVLDSFEARAPVR